jgi:hypothetical protein
MTFDIIVLASLLGLTVAMFAWVVALKVGVSRETARCRVLSDVVQKQKIVEIVLWAVDCARVSLPDGPSIDIFSSYSEERLRFLREVSHLESAAHLFSRKWGVVWGDPSHASLGDCAAEAVIVIDDILETVDCYSGLMDKFLLAAKTVNPGYEAPTICATVRQCLRHVKGSVKSYARHEEPWISCSSAV